MTTPVSSKPAAPRRQRPSRRVPDETRAVPAGAWLVRHRRWLPLPFILVALLVPGQARLSQWIIGLSLVAAGEAMRVAAVAALEGAGQRSRGADRLVTYGLFAWTRNPLYLGSFLGWIGFAIVAGTLWLAPLAILLFAAAYSLIVRHEEAVLDASFGDRYESYRNRTPRWLPRRPRVCLAGDHAWDAALRAELRTVVTYLALAGTFALEQLYF